MANKEQFEVESYAFGSSVDLQHHLNEKMADEYLKVISVASAGNCLVIIYRKMKGPAFLAGQSREWWDQWEKEHPKKEK